MLEAEGTKLEGQLQGVIDAVRRAAKGLRNAVHDLRIEEELDRPFPELVETLMRRNRSMGRGYEIDLEVEAGFPSYPFGETGTSSGACFRSRSPTSGGTRGPERSRSY